MAKKQSGLQTFAASDLEAELRRRKKSTASLIRKRDRFLKKAAEIDSQLAHIGALSGMGQPGKRFRNEATLPDSLAAVLKGKTMSVTEAAEAVQKAGYRTGAANFRTMINIALIKDKRFKRVARGQYTAR